MNHNPLIWAHATVRAEPLLQHMRLMVVWVAEPASIFLIFLIMVLADSTFAVVTRVPIMFESLATTCSQLPAVGPVSFITAAATSGLWMRLSVGGQSRFDANLTL